MNPEEKLNEQEELLKNQEANEEAQCNDNETDETEQNEPEVELTPEQLLEKQLAEAQDKIEELQDRYLRQMADFDNYRKNAMKSKAELIKNGGEKTITAILPVLDDFERAIATMEKAADVDAIKEGVNLIFQKFLKVLSSEGLAKIETEGKDFDTDYHEAIAMIPAPSDDLKGKVIDCVQTGYTLNEKVIRHSKVAVGQ